MSTNLGNISVELLNSFLTPYLNNRSQMVSNNFSSSSSMGMRIPVDIVNEEKTITIYAEVPGVDKNSIEIDFFNNRLTICAEKQRTYDNLSMTETEILYGKLERQITLPICVTRKETVNVSHKNGILKIKINKLIEEENKFSIRVNE